MPATSVGWPPFLDFIPPNNSSGFQIGAGCVPQASPKAPAGKLPQSPLSTATSRGTSDLVSGKRGEAGKRGGNGTGHNLVIGNCNATGNCNTVDNYNANRDNNEAGGCNEIDNKTKSGGGTKTG